MIVYLTLAVASSLAPVPSDLLVETARLRPAIRREAPAVRREALTLTANLKADVELDRVWAIHTSNFTPRRPGLVPDTSLASHKTSSPG